MTPRENLLSLLRRQGYQTAPAECILCPSLEETFRQKTGQTDYAAYFQFPFRRITPLPDKPQDAAVFRSYYPNLHPQAQIDRFGIAREPGSAAAMHMTYMRNPLAGIQSLSELQAYPFPELDTSDLSAQTAEVQQLHREGLAAVGQMDCTIWEHAWYMRGMENLMVDMMLEDEKAACLLDWVTADACASAAAYASAGVDILYVGDDIGMQHSIMMSETLYRTWIKPRLKQVIAAARAVKPDIIVFYHSCGYVTPFIEDLIEAGVDVLNPVQPECMDFADIHRQFGSRLSFYGTIGTQTTMPFGTPNDVRRAVFRNLEIAGDKGGLLCTPTHMLEPEVPWENIVSYVQACRDFK